MKRMIILMGALTMLLQTACSEEEIMADMKGASQSLYSDGTGLDVALGDVNGDGLLNPIDMLKIGQYVAGQNPSDFIVDAADVNCDGAITEVDGDLIGAAFVGTVEGYSCRAEGFESLADWTTTSGLSLSLTDASTQGSSGLAIAGSGSGDIVSSPLFPTTPGNRITLDVRKSYDLMPNSWNGQISMLLNCHSQNIDNAYLGFVNLNDTYPGKFQQVEFSLDEATQAALEAGCDELTLTIQASLPSAADALVIDNLQFSTDMGECKAVYDGHNDVTDASRYNVVMVTRGFNSEAEELSALKRIIAMDDTETVPGTSGLMQIVPLNQLQDKFNFFYVTSPGTTTITDGGIARTEWETQSARCQRYLPNAVYAFLLQPNTTTNYPWVASWGRGGAGLADCRANPSCAVDDRQGAVHEMLHSIFLFVDEYEQYDNNPPETFDLVNGTLTAHEQNFMWAGDSYTDCIANSPWADMVGDGCGDDGVIDCINTVACPLPLAGDWNNWSSIANCCLPEHPDCYTEIACFEGIMYHDTNLWRPTGQDLMRSHGWIGYEPDTYLSIIKQDFIINAVMAGPDSIHP